MCSVWISEQTVSFALYIVNRLVFITEVERVYCVVSTESLYRVIHKSVKHFKNSQQIDYATDHGNPYADKERNSPSFFYIFHRCSMCAPLVIRQTSMR
jgi:hypothetical protein